MKLEREPLLKALETAKPALATKELIEELLCFWMDGKTLTAYNDASLGIQVPFVSELKGGLRGSILLGMLSHSRAKDVEIELPTEGEALIKAGRTKLKLSLLDAEKAIWEMPKLGKAKGYKLSKAFLEAMKLVLLSIGNNSAKPDTMGVTVILQGGLQFYSTDDKTISWATIKDVDGWPLKPGVRTTIPTEFITQLLRIADDKTELFLTENDVLAKTVDGVRLFARLIDVPSPMNYKKIIDESMGGIQLVTIPVRLKLALERATIMLEGHDEEAVEVEIADDVLRLYAKTAFGELRDSIKLEEFPKPVKIKVNPAMMKRGLPYTANMGMSGELTVMSGKNFLYLISNQG